MFVGSHQELENTAWIYYQSPPSSSNMIWGLPRPQQLGLAAISLRSSQHVPEIPGTLLQLRIEKLLGSEFQVQVGALHTLMVDAISKLSVYQNHLQA